jgi:tRNA(Arg) A34 adenosine deaminase TadA
VSGTLPAALHVALPGWLTELVCPPLPGLPERMAFVIELSRRNVATGSGGPFAAAVFEAASGRLLAAGANLVVRNHCSAAHAEVLALSLAQQALCSHDLGAPGLPVCELVSSCEPCAMCIGAVAWSGVQRLVFAAREADARAIGFDEGPKHPDWAGELRRRGMLVTGDLLRADAVAVLESYRTVGGPIYNGCAGPA